MKKWLMKFVHIMKFPVYILVLFVCVDYMIDYMNEPNTISNILGVLGLVSLLVITAIIFSRWLIDSRIDDMINDRLDDSFVKKENK